MRVAFIGDSHVACLAEALRDHPDPPHRVFAAPRLDLREVRFEDERLVVSSDRARRPMERLSGASEIRYEEHDAIVWVGSVLGRLRPPSFRDGGRYHLPRRAADAVDAPGVDVEWIDDRLFRRALGAGVVGRLTRFGELGARAHRPVVAVPRPYLARRSDRVAVAGPVAEFLRDEWEDLVRSTAVSQGVGVVLQPEETVVDVLYSGDQWSRGSVGLAGSTHDDDDVDHLNGDYGAILLKHVLSSI